MAATAPRPEAATLPHNPLAGFLKASGLRVHGGETGFVYRNSGIIRFDTAPRLGCDGNLFAVLKIVVDLLGLQIAVSSVDTGKHTRGSRHTTGRAVDIYLIGIVEVAWHPVTPEEPHTMRLVDYLLKHGFQAGEGGPHPGLLLGPVRSRLNPSTVDHMDHCHVSVPK